MNLPRTRTALPWTGPQPNLAVPAAGCNKRGNPPEPRRSPHQDVRPRQLARLATASHRRPVLGQGGQDLDAAISAQDGVLDLEARDRRVPGEGLVLANDGGGAGGGEDLAVGVAGGTA